MNDGVESLKQTIAGADILVCTVPPWALGAQRDIIRAAKEVGVKRVVPCDFGTIGARGVRALYDVVCRFSPISASVPECAVCDAVH